MRGFGVENDVVKVYLFVKKKDLKRKNIVKIEFCVMPIIGNNNIVAIPLQMAYTPVTNRNPAV